MLRTKLRRCRRTEPRRTATTDLANRHRRRQNQSLNLVEWIPIRLDDGIPEGPGLPRRQD